ncbi:MAG: hypothetical protein HYY92_03555 [Parcubacteria group bacterium]|nr:hypothetical protein [Parcubacteria group bacterium]
MSILAWVLLVLGSIVYVKIGVASAKWALFTFLSIIVPTEIREGENPNTFENGEALDVVAGLLVVVFWPFFYLIYLAEGIDESALAKGIGKFTRKIFDTYLAN